jgi:hypothetical protein
LNVVAVVAVNTLGFGLAIMIVILVSPFLISLAHISFFLRSSRRDDLKFKDTTSSQGQIVERYNNNNNRAHSLVVADTMQLSESQ